MLWFAIEEPSVFWFTLGNICYLIYLQRAKRWSDRMDEMGVERYRLANMLMETLDIIEQESGIFLIKPMYSYRGR